MRSNIRAISEIALGRIDARPIGEACHNATPTPGTVHQPCGRRDHAAPTVGRVDRAVLELFEERLANAQHWLGDRKQNGIVRNEFQYPRLEPSPGHDTDPQAENL